MMNSWSQIKWFYIPVIITFFYFLHVEKGRSQEMLGIVNSNYSGINSILINPANSGTSRHMISVNLIAGDLFVNSNYFYIHKKDYSFLKIFSVDISDPQYMYIYNYPEYSFKDTVQYYDYLKNESPKNLYFNARIAGPSFMLRKGRHAISFISGFRNNASIEDIPYDVANFGFRGQDFEPQHNIPYEHGEFRFAALSWLELGLGYTYTFFKDASKELNAGIAVKALLGTGAAYGRIDNISYMVPNHDSIYFYQLNGDLVLDLPMDYATNTFSLSNPLIRGWGLGFDVGVTYTRKGTPVLGSTVDFSKNQEPEDEYLYKLGASLLDAGKINFTQSVQFHEFKNVNNVLWSGLSDFHPRSLQEFVRSASFHLLGDSMSSLTGQSRFGIFLPTAISVQGDYYFGKSLFVNASIVQGVRIGQPSVRRPSLIAITPRFETRIFEINLPISLYDFRDPAVGLAIRIYSFVIGTEKLGTLFNFTDVRGMDLYFSLGININPKNKNWQDKSSRRTGKCESYEDYKRYRVK